MCLPSDLAQVVFPVNAGPYNTRLLRLAPPNQLSQLLRNHIIRVKVPDQRTEARREGG